MTTKGSYKIINQKVVLILLLFFTNGAFSQEEDSTDIYIKIKKAASKRSFTTFLYDAVFVDPAPKEYPVEPATHEKNVNPYLKHTNKIIRNINITVYNPFGHKVEDTIRNFNNFLENIANHVHINTRHWIIINRLLFKKNDTLNPLALSETERLLRQAEFVNDARIYTSNEKKSDSIDVNVDVYDKWPITAPSYIAPQEGSIRFRNQNLFGLGQEFEQYVGFKTPNTFDYNGFYRLTNIDNTYISSQLSYQTNVDGTTIDLSFDRPYFSPLTKWAGGTSVNHSWGFYDVTDSVTDLVKRYTLNSLAYDIWAGKSFKLKKGKALFNQSTNIIVGERYYNTTFMARPSFSIDTAKFNANTSAFVGNIGLSIQQFYKDKFIYRFGAYEDVPEGLIVQLIYGAAKNEFSKLRYYGGVEIARAKKFNFGYITSTASYGLFFNNTSKNDITTRFKLNYLANLIKKGRWYFREFLYYNLVHGENKLIYETITINPEEMYGFDGSLLTGSTKMLLNFETVAYAPYDVIGFRFAPIITAGLAMIGNQKRTLEKSPLFQAYSIGLMIRNEHLVSSTFQISIGMYPFLPDGKNNVFSFNPITSFTLRVRGFSMGKPQFISYD